MERLGFAISGCGMIADYHARAILGLDQARLIAAADPNEAARQAFAARYRVPALADLASLLENPAVDVISICTPSGLHARQAIQAAQAGKHIVVEKPMALNLPEADAIIAACRAAGVKLTVISQLRFTDAVRQSRAALAAGRLGRLVSGDVYMKYHRSEEYYRQGGWRGTWQMDGGGALINQGIHGVDLLLHLMGPVRSVYATSATLAHPIAVEDTLAAVLEFQNGALGVIQATTSVWPGSARRLEINGTQGSIRLEEDRITGWELSGQKQSKLAKQPDPLPGTASDPAAFDSQGHRLQLQDMIRAILADENPW